jgi:hypothetical protein
MLRVPEKREGNLLVYVLVFLLGGLVGVAGIVGFLCLLLWAADEENSRNAESAHNKIPLRNAEPVHLTYH